jgi:hypothetical protein
LQQGLTDLAQTARQKYSNEALGEMEAITTEKYGQWLDGVKVPKIDMENTISAIKGIYENLSKTGKQTADVILLSAKEGNELPIAAIQKLKTQMGTLTRGNIDIRQALNKAMREDISKVEGGEAAVQALSEADQVYRLQKVGRDINNLFKRSMENDGVTEKFLPLRFEQNYTEQFRKKISRDAGDIVPLLDELLTISRAAKGDIAKLKSFDASKYIPMINLGAAGGLGIWSAFYDPEKAKYAALIPLGMGMSHSLMTPKGALNKWLTSGWDWAKSPAIQEGLKMGGRVVMQGRGQGNDAESQ